MLNARGEIPTVSNRRLGYLARQIYPVASFTAFPLGKWPQEDVRVFRLLAPQGKERFEQNFLEWERFGLSHLFTSKHRLKTFHGNQWTNFHPTLAEVLAQIPEEWLKDRDVVAFETFPNPEFHISRCDEKTGFHEATTVLLGRASPPTGEFFKTYYSIRG